MSPTRNSRDAQSVWAAMIGCLVMIAYHVGSKALRDALFLSKFDVTALPTMVIVASLFSIVAVLIMSRAMMRISPARLMPWAFAVSAVLQMGVWLSIDAFPRLCAVIMYLQSVTLGSLLTSGFWSVINERFDPRTAKQLVGRIAGAGTLGGMIGGVVAERIAAKFSLPVMIPVLAGYHLACAGLLLLVNRGSPEEAPRNEERGPSGLDILQQAPYLKTLAALVILGTISAAMIDYVFKSSALSFYGRNENLMRFFAAFYSVTGVLTFVVQTGFSSLSLNYLGMARTVGTLPFAVSIGAFGALLTAAGLWPATIARGLEAVFRGSLFRAGYELFYTPMPTQDKRAAKSIVDVGFDRMGDAVGSGLVSLLLNLGPAVANPAILTVSILVALGGLYVATRLQGAYIDALEHGLRERGGELAALEDVNNSVALTGFADSLTVLEAGKISRAPASELPSTVSRRNAVRNKRPITAPPSTPSAPATVSGAAVSGPSTILSDTVLQQIATLRSGNPDRVVNFLQSGQHVRGYLIPHLIALLGWDKVSAEVIEALRRCAEQHTGQLTDALLDESTDFAIRRRIPRVLSVVSTPRVAAGILQGLNDRRFEVRYQCGRALAAMMTRNPYLKFNADEVYGAIRKEVAVSRPVWESHRLLDRSEDPESPELLDEFLRERTNRSLQHLFTLLALIHPPEPLRIALHGLHADDPQLKGTALEYLESILPTDIRTRLWPLLDNELTSEEQQDPRSRDEILAELMKSNQSIMVRLEELKKRDQTASNNPTV